MAISFCLHGCIFIVARFIIWVNFGYNKRKNCSRNNICRVKARYMHKICVYINLLYAFSVWNNSYLPKFVVIVYLLCSIHIGSWMKHYTVVIYLILCFHIIIYGKTYLCFHFHSIYILLFYSFMIICAFFYCVPSQVNFEQ